MEEDRAINPTSKPTLESVRQRFETWRSQKKVRDRIPKCLWSAAVEQCEDHSVLQVSRALRLNFNKLKRRAEDSKRTAVSKNEEHVGFVELALGTSFEPFEGTLELEAADGAKLKLRFRGNCRDFSLHDFAKAFWRQGR
ncbi:MAG: hypothetical protein ACE5I0_05625 [Candidatus Binatia bacterium]